MPPKGIDLNQTKGITNINHSNVARTLSCDVATCICKCTWLVDLLQQSVQSLLCIICLVSNSLDTRISRGRACPTSLIELVCLRVLNDGVDGANSSQKHDGDKHNDVDDVKPVVQALLAGLHDDQPDD